MAANRIPIFAPTGPHLKAPSSERRFFFAYAFYYLHSTPGLMRNGELTAASRSERRTALRGQDRHIPVLRAEHGISAAEQLVQCLGEPDFSIVMHPRVITSSVRSVDAPGGLCVQKTEGAQLRLADGHGCDP
jgi:hypothetical protein